MKKTNIKIAIFLILSILILAFIFYNSTRGRDESNGMSSDVMENILKVLDPAGKLDREVVHYFVRKGAHFAEFLVLGLTLSGMMLAISEKTVVFYKSLLFLIAILAAVCDEIIQSFTSRSSSARDVLLDFCGSACGILIAILVDRIIKKAKRTK